MEVALSSIQMYNSQFNVNATLYNNNTFSVIMPTGATTVQYDFTLANGSYSYSDITNVIQLRMVQQGAYLIDATGNNVYYIKIQTNATYYSASIDVASVPTALPPGFTRPSTGLYSSGGSGLPTTAFTPQIILSSGFGILLGFNASTVPATQTTSGQSFLSTKVPQINPVSNCVCRCNLIKNAFSNPPDVLTSFTTQGTSIGQMVSVNPNELAWLDVTDGARSYIEIIITDQNGSFIKFEDNQINILLLLRQKATKKE
ncbi:Aste57867_15263 [Aphanomyces stellatus]|uniref:Aste57867_15263 protein n=1 Tax=Aphanomyces stellatus TaxID=120398 RepID=A0A485L3B9_9STRA|nr:hypothetical protein As57867_015207 [Aphanomyces stellatus]VFT92072.1 Aste57867_15263 [Aphanomyces stellatus]